MPRDVNLFLGEVQLPVLIMSTTSPLRHLYSYDINLILCGNQDHGYHEVKTYKLGPNKSLVAVDATDKARKESRS